MVDDDALSAMFTPEQIEEMLEREAGKGDVRDGRVCICGHGFMKHIELASLGRWTCAPGRHRCRCLEPRAVIETSDTRGFMAKTEGPGEQHALIRGLLAAKRLAVKQERELNAVWTVELTCWKCGSADDVQPIALTKSGAIANSSGDFNVLACAECRASAESAE